MKITIALSLVTIALAIPTNHQRNFYGRAPIGHNLPDSIIREKKSPLENVAGDAPEIATEDLSTLVKTKTPRHSPMEGRNFGLQKPIIIKKKIGYHVYRDSDEEMAHADPHENCRNQVKVKLCDDEPGAPKSIGNCFTSERINEDIAEKEIENSIKTAKKAVENLQRGFHKMEHTSAKLANTEDIDKDHEVHHHIEAARKALEHVQQNFGHLDTFDGAVAKTQHSHPKLSDDERLAMWKEAIDNIQKNFEIARNIEDAFKVEPTHTQPTDLKGPSKMRETEHAELIDGFKSNAESSRDIKIVPNDSDVLIKQKEVSDGDMFTSSMEQKELNVKLHSDNLKSEILAPHDESSSSNNIEEKTTNLQELNDMKQQEQMPFAKHNELTTKMDESIKPDELMMTKKTIEDSEPIHKSESKADKGMIANKLQNDEHQHIPTNPQSTKKDALETEDINLDINDRSDLKFLTSSEKLERHNTLSESNEMNAQKKLLDMKDEHHDEHTLKLKSATKFDEHNHGLMKSENKKHVPQMHLNDKLMTPEKHIIGGKNEQHMHHEHLSMRETQENVKFNSEDNMHSNFIENSRHLEDHTSMRMKEGEENNHQSMENQRLREPFSTSLSQMDQVNGGKQPILDGDTSGPAKFDFNNEQHFTNEHTRMRFNQDIGKGHHLNDNKDLQESFKQWTQEKQLNELIQQAKTANELHNIQMMASNSFNHRQNIFEEQNNMRMEQHQNTRNQIPDEINLHDPFFTRFAQESHHKNMFKIPSDMHGQDHLHEILPQTHFDSANTHEFSQLGPRMNDHLHIMKHSMSPDMDSAMQPSMHMSMRDSNGKPSEHNLLWNNHHHAMARYGSSLPIAGVSPGAVGVFPNGNTGCGIPLMLSCSPSVVSGSLAKAHPTAIATPAYRSDDDLMFYMKRDATDTEDLPAFKIHKSSIPFNHKSELIFDKTQ